jgi:hypothetical protein
MEACHRRTYPGCDGGRHQDRDGHEGMGVGDFSKEIEAFAEKLGFDCVRI